MCGLMDCIETLQIQVRTGDVGVHNGVISFVCGIFKELWPFTLGISEYCNSGMEFVAYLYSTIQLYVQLLIYRAGLNTICSDSTNSHNGEITSWVFARFIILTLRTLYLMKLHFCEVSKVI